MQTEMKPVVHSYADLKAEIARFTELKQQKELQLRSRVRNLSEQLKPINLVKNAVSSLTGDNEYLNTFTHKGVEAAVGFLLSNVVFRKAGAIMRAIATILGTTALTQVVEENKADYLRKIRDLLRKFRRKTSTRRTADFNEMDIYKTE